jgi:hypothetical protein
VGSGETTLLAPNQIQVSRVDEDACRLAEDEDGIEAMERIGEERQLLWGIRAGVVAGLVLTTTLNYFAFAHRSLANVMMTAFMVWALYFLLLARRDGSLRPLLAVVRSA